MVTSTPRIRLPRVLRLGMLALLAAPGPACVARLVNKHFPPIDTTAKKLEAISTSQQQLAALPARDVQMNASRSDLQAVVAPAVMGAVPGLTRLDLSLAKPAETITNQAGETLRYRNPPKPTAPLHVTLLPGDSVV